MVSFAIFDCTNHGGFRVQCSSRTGELEERFPLDSNAYFRPTSLVIACYPTTIQCRLVGLCLPSTDWILPLVDSSCLWAQAGGSMDMVGCRYHRDTLVMVTNSGPILSIRPVSLLLSGVRGRTPHRGSQSHVLDLLRTSDIQSETHIWDRL